jgi:uncharacterized membrane protein YgcG
MKKLLFGLATIAVLVVFSIGPVGASVNDFIVKDFQADYYLDRDIDGRSVLTTTELIGVQFPNYDQNHGIERALPLIYDGHQTSLSIQSVTDDNGAALQYKTHNSNDNLVVRIGNANAYVYGLHYYKITYTQRDVTRYFTDTNSDEFYWDVNGNEWLQKFENVSVRLHLSDSLMEALNGQQACYYGVYGSNNKCSIARSDNVLAASVDNIGAGQNVSIAVGFEPGTFAEYQMSQMERLWAMIVVIYGFVFGLSILLIVVLLIRMIFLRIKEGKGAPGRGTIVAEYLPPKDSDVALSSVIINKPANWTAAMYVDLAVRHNIKIIERKEGLFKQRVYSLEYVSDSKLNDNELSVIKALFGDNPQVGNRYDLKRRASDYKLVAAMSKIYKKIKKSAKTEGYYEENKPLKAKMTKITIAIAILGVITMFVGIFGVIFALVIMLTMRPLSQKGRELFDYLKGLEVYIKTAEEDRIKVLQSPEGAEKTPVDTNDSGLMIHLYERVLPYAVLFGNEKEWAKELGKFYEQQGSVPDWYAGSDMFNAVLFSSALSGFKSTAVTNSYSSPTSSSSGGSGGGGFSGGGGGGGGGGGW